MLDLPIKLVDSIFLEEDWDHGYVFFICIIGVIHSRCEDSGLPLLKVSSCFALIFKETNNCKIPCHSQHTSAHCHQSECWYSPECLSSYKSWENILTGYSIVWQEVCFFPPSLEAWNFGMTRSLPWELLMSLPVVVEGRCSPDGWVNASEDLISLFIRGRITKWIHS